MFRIKVSRLSELMNLLAGHGTLYVPAEDGRRTDYQLWTEHSVLSLEHLKTVTSPKRLFLPQSEILYTCSQDCGKMMIQETDLPDQPLIVFGIRACDRRGLEILDQVYLADPVDRYYAARREAAILISLACSEPDPSCFCTLFGIDPASPGADITTWIADGELYWQANSAAGTELTGRLVSLLEPVEESVEEPAAVVAGGQPLANALSLAELADLTLHEAFDLPIWEELSETCLSCGTCTFVCPTCQCYDIGDFDNGRSAARFRCWDSCMYSDFTRMAHGNPRTTRAQRFRQRFMHKLVYHPDNHDGTYGCVGCGRCLERCPASLSIVKVIRQMRRTADV